MVPPISTPFWSGIRSITGYGVFGSISVELARLRPRTLRATSMTTMWRP
jgi:hypothetical protein